MNEDKKTPEVDVDLDLDLNIDSPPLQGASLSFFVHFLKEWCSLKQWIHPERFLRSLLKSSSSSSLPFPFFWNTLLHALSTPLLVPSSDSLPHEHWGSLLPCQENETVGFEGTRSPWVTGWTTVSHCLHATFHELLLNNHVITLETNQKKEGKEDPAPVHPHVLKSEERKEKETQRKEGSSWVDDPFSSVRVHPKCSTSISLETLENIHPGVDSMESSSLSNLNCRASCLEVVDLEKRENIEKKEKKKRKKKKKMKVRSKWIPSCSSVGVTLDMDPIHSHHATFQEDVEKEVEVEVVVDNENEEDKEALCALLRPLPLNLSLNSSSFLNSNDENLDFIQPLNPTDPLPNTHPPPSPSPSSVHVTHPIEVVPPLPSSSSSSSSSSPFSSSPTTHPVLEKTTTPTTTPTPLLQATPFVTNMKTKKKKKKKTTPPSSSMANHDDPTTVLPPMSTDLDSLPSSSWSASSSSSSSLCSSSSSSSSFFFPQVLHAPQVLRYVHHTFQGAGLPIFSSSSSSFSLSRVAGTSSCKGRERGVEEEEEEEEGSWRTWRGQEEVPGPTQGFMEWGHRLTLELNHFDAYVRSHLEVPPHLQSTVWKRVQTCLRASPLSSTLPHVNVVLQPSLLYGCPPFVPLPRNKSKTKWIHEPCVHLTLLPLNPPSSSLPHPHRWVSVTIDLFKPFVRSLAPLSHLSPFIYTPPPSSTSSSSSSSLSSDLPVLLFIDAETNVPVCLHWTFLEAQEQRPRAALFFSSVTGTLENDDDHEKNDGQEQKPENDPPSPGQEGGKEERPTSSTPLTVLLRYLSWVTCFFDLPVSLTQWHTLLQWVLGPEPRDTAPTLPPPSSHRPFLPLQPGHGLLAVLWFYGWTLHDAAVLAQNPVDEKRDEGWSTQPSTTSSSFLTPEDPSSPSSLSLQHQYAHHVWQWYQTSHVVPPYSVLRKLCQFLFYQCHAPNASTLLLERTLDMDWVQRYLEKEMKDMKKFKKKP